jgi:hypothetical protein
MLDNQLHGPLPVEMVITPMAIQPTLPKIMRDP